MNSSDNNEIFDHNFLVSLPSTEDRSSDCKLFDSKRVRIDLSVVFCCESGWIVRVDGVEKCRQMEKLRSSK